MNPGDFVRHCRQGPGRITQVLPEYVEVKSRLGNVYKVSSAVAEYELVPVPPDGFAALLATRDPSSDFLMENIVEVTRRIFRDRRKVSVSKKELREELKPFLQREDKSFTNWWKRAQKKLLESGAVIADPKKKKTHLAISNEAGAESEQNWTAALDKVNSSADLLDYARRLHATDADDTRATDVAASVAKRAGRELTAAPPNSRARLELLLVFAYIGLRLNQEAKAHWAKLIEEIDLAGLPWARDLDEDIALVLPLIGKMSARKATQWAAMLLDYPSIEVAKRAFHSLNTDRSRSTLKERLFQWLYSGDAQVAPAHLDLYLDDAFLSYLRKEDKGMLYARLSMFGQQTQATRSFLARPQYVQLAADLHRDDARAGLRAVSGKQLDKETRLRLIAGLGPDSVLETVLSDVMSDLSPYLCDAVEKSSWASLSRNWTRLMETIVSTNSARLHEAVVKRIQAAVQDADVITLLKAVAFGCELSSVLKQPDNRLDRLLQAGCSRLLRANDIELAPLTNTVEAEITSSTAELRGQLNNAQNDVSLSNERARAAEQEVQRLRDVIAIVKKSAGEDRTGTKQETLREFVRSLLPFLDEIQRRAAAGDKAAHRLYDEMIGAYNQSGLQQVGDFGEVEGFNPQVHRLLDESSTSVSNVVIIRSGYVLKYGNEEVIVRHALVRPLEEDVH